MKRKRTIIFIAVGVTGIALIAFALGAIYHYRVLSVIRLPKPPKIDEVPVLKVTIKDANAQISEMKRWINEVEPPKDAQIAIGVTDAVQQVGQLWQEWQDLLNSGQIRIRPWEGTTLTSGSWESQDGKTNIWLLFRSKERRISQYTKRIYSSKDVVDQFYYFEFFNDLGELEYCELDDREFLWFYPGDKISRYARKVEPTKEGFETWYEIEWDENGRITQERTRTWEKLPIQKTFERRKSKDN